MSGDDQRVFGEDAARADALLSRCTVRRQRGQRTRPIVVGRWGTGKTATLLLRHRTLAEALRAKSPTADELWYIDETALNTQSVIDIVGGSNDPRSANYHLRLVWQAEIYRRTAQMLCLLAEDYKGVSGQHWEFVRRLRSHHTTSLWGSLRNVFDHFVNPMVTPAVSVDDLSGAFTDFLDPASHSAVKNCLFDIKEHSLRPAIGIEPIETPASAVESHGNIADGLVLALLNVFQESFSPGVHNALSVSLAIPWHRFSRSKLDHPQKLLDMYLTLKWTAEELGEFVHLRIEYEFNRVKRRSKITHKDLWSHLFAPSFLNTDYKPAIRENSFAFFLRHSHYRPRDIQQLIRRAVELCAASNNVDTDAVLRGDRQMRVDGEHMQRAVRELNRDQGEDRFTEACRAFPELAKIRLAIASMPTPFDIDHLVGRLQKHQVQGVTVDEAIVALWESGVIGLTLPAQRDVGLVHLSITDADLTIYRAEPSGAQHRRYYFTHYNRDVDILSFVRAIEAADVKPEFYIHSMFESVLFPLAARTHPFGV